MVATSTLIEVGMPLIIEVVRLGNGLIDRFNKGELTQEEFELEWNKMQVPFNSAVAAYIEFRMQQHSS